MEFFDAVAKRKSVRSYREMPLRRRDLKRILSAAIRAPSAGNLQPWSFVVSESKEKKRALAEAAHSQGFISEAPVVVTVCALASQSAARYGERGIGLYCLQDTAAAIENLLLAATALGYGTCWVGAFDEESVRDVLGMPDSVRPVALIPIGFPDVVAEGTGRKPLETLVHHETYGGKRSR